MYEGSKCCGIKEEKEKVKGSSVQKRISTYPWAYVAL